MRILEKLNTLGAVLVVLTIALAVNGYLFYRQHAASPTAGDTSPSATSNAIVADPEETTASEVAVSERAESPDTTVPEDTRPEESQAAEVTDVLAASGRATSIDLGGLGRSIQECEGDEGSCVRDFVAAAAPQARYVGGRTDLNAGGSGLNERILYFEYPDLTSCEYARQRYVADDGHAYTVIIVGQGSFYSEGGAECIPTA